VSASAHNEQDYLSIKDRHDTLTCFFHPVTLTFEREKEFIIQMNKQIKQIQISTVAGYQ